MMGFIHQDQCFLTTLQLLHDKEDPEEKYSTSNHCWIEYLPKRFIRDLGARMTTMPSSLSMSVRLQKLDASPVTG